MILVREMLKDYNKLDETCKLDLDIAVSTLRDSGQISDNMFEVINLVKNQYTSTEIADILNVDRVTVNRRLNKVCLLLAKRLGDTYQDSKIISLTASKLGRDLTDEEEKFCWYMINHVSDQSVSKKLSIYNFKIVNGKVVIGDG